MTVKELKAFLSMISDENIMVYVAHPFEAEIRKVEYRQGNDDVQNNPYVVVISDNPEVR